MEVLEKVIFVVGPTCSGKTELALGIAKKMGNIEIICADSRTIYRGMDVGTAKPDENDRKICPHHFLDIINPDESYSAGQFKKSAEKLIQEIHLRNRIPVVVGGTGLYAFSLIYNYSFPAGPSNRQRSDLESKDLEELKSTLQYLDIDAYENIDINNKRRVIRAIETAGMNRTMSDSKPANYLLIGICPEKDNLEQRIKPRTEKMFQKGLLEEVEYLLSKYGNVEALNTVGYKEVVGYLNKEQNLATTKELINLHTRQLAKRQMTWFKRSKDIMWVKNYAEGIEAFNKFMQI